MRNWFILCECPRCLAVTTWIIPALPAEVTPYFRRPTCKAPSFIHPSGCGITLNLISIHLVPAPDAD